VNALSLVQRVARRNPSYDQSEYLDECNAAYKETWDYILQLDDSYFTDIKTVTVTTTAAEFDFLANFSGNLSSAVSLRAFQIDRIRILQPGDTNWNKARPRNWNDDDFQAQQQITPQVAATSGPYLYQLFSKFSVIFAQPLPTGTQIEVVYSFIWMPLAIVFNGTVQSTGTAVTGTATNFTQVVPADFASALPGNDQDTDIGMELVFNQGANNQTFRVKAITNDTAITLLTAPNPAIPALTTYNLCSVPDIPDGHHNVISTIATRNFMSTPGNDPRFSAWAALAEKELDSMRDSIMVRQRQEPARVKPFPQRLQRDTVSPSGSRCWLNGVGLRQSSSKLKPRQAHGY
jgi:hypothetical protein